MDGSGANRELNLSIGAIVRRNTARYDQRLFWGTSPGL
jgi:hypothetical protein